MSCKAQEQLDTTLPLVYGRQARMPMSIYVRCPRQCTRTLSKASLSKSHHDSKEAPSFGLWPLAGTAEHVHVLTVYIDCTCMLASEPRASTSMRA